MTKAAVRVGKTVSSVGLGYLLGMVPFADLAARAVDRDTDLREVGSTNPGAMNVATSMNKAVGLGVFAADVGKGALAGHIGRLLAGPVGANLASAAAVAGHCYPVLPKGRTGGKGVSTSIGQVIATFPRYLPADLAVGLVTAALPKWTQRTWAATATASVTWVSASMVAYARGWRTGTDTPAPLALPIASALSSAVIAKRFLDTPLQDGKPKP